MVRDLHPSEFITRTNLGNPVRVGSYNMVPGTVVRLRNSIFVLVAAIKGPHQWLLPYPRTARGPNEPAQHRHPACDPI